MDPIIKNKLDEYNQFCQDTVNTISSENHELTEKLSSVEKKYKKIETEFKNYQKVSYIQQMNTLLFEKENEISFLKKKIKKLEKKPK